LKRPRRRASPSPMFSVRYSQTALSAAITPCRSVLCPGNSGDGDLLAGSGMAPVRSWLSPGRWGAG
jgi:hypothetical protein